MVVSKPFHKKNGRDTDSDFHAEQSRCIARDGFHDDILLDGTVMDRGPRQVPVGDLQANVTGIQG
jgi:hypothetical protein